MDAHCSGPQDACLCHDRSTGGCVGHRARQAATWRSPGDISAASRPASIVRLLGQLLALNMCSRRTRSSPGRSAADQRRRYSRNSVLRRPWPMQKQSSNWSSVGSTAAAQASSTPAGPIHTRLTDRAVLTGATAGTGAFDKPWLLAHPPQHCVFGTHVWPHSFLLPLRRFFRFFFRRFFATASSIWKSSPGRRRNWRRSDHPGDLPRNGDWEGPDEGIEAVGIQDRLLLGLRHRVFAWAAGAPVCNRGKAGGVRRPFHPMPLLSYGQLNRFRRRRSDHRAPAGSGRFASHHFAVYGMGVCARHNCPGRMLARR